MAMSRNQAVAERSKNFRANNPDAGEFLLGEEPGFAREQSDRLRGVAQDYGQMGADAQGRTFPGIDTAAADAARAEQMRALTAYRNAARAPEGPSMAGAQLTMGRDANMLAALRQSRSGQPGASGQAMTGAMLGNTQAQGALNFQAGQARAAERDRFLGQQLAATADIAGAYGDLRGQDLTQAQNISDAQLQGRRVNDAFDVAAQNLALGYEGAAFGTDQSQADLTRDYYGIRRGVYDANAMRDAQQDAALINAGAQGGASFAGMMMDHSQNQNSQLSDERSKQQIERLETENNSLLQALRSASPEYPSPRQPDVAALDKAHAQQMVREAPGYEYEYKNPSAPGAAPGRHVGPMAQDLERTPMGRSLVSETPDGTKMVDGGRAGLASLAAVSAQQEQLDQVEQEAERTRRELEALRAAYPGGF